MEKRRTTLSLLLTAVGAGLLFYGLFSQAAVVSLGEQEKGQIVPQSELAVVQEVARGGLKRDESGEIKKTYEEGEKAPAACPT
jgi:hypothetical protein